MRELWNNILHTSGARIYSVAIGILVLFLTARLLGPEGRGHVAAIQTWVNLFSTFAGLSLGQVALNRMASDPGHLRIGQLLGSLLLLTFVVTLLGWSVALIMILINPETAFKGLPSIALLIGFLALPLMIWEQYGSSLLIGLERIHTYNRSQIIGRTLSVFAVFILVAGLGLGVTGVMQANLLGQTIAALGGLGFLIKFSHEKGKHCRPKQSEIKALLSGGAKLHLNAIGTFLFASANVLILSYYHGAEQTGYFQLAVQLISVFMIAPQAASMVIFGKVTRLGPNGAWVDNKRLLIQMVFVMIVLSAIASITAPWVIPILVGNSFEPSIQLFQWMLLGLVGMTFSSMMAPQWIGRGYFILAAGITFSVGIVNLVASFYLIPTYGAMGAVYTHLFTYSLSIVGNGMMFLHCQKMSLDETHNDRFK